MIENMFLITLCVFYLIFYLWQRYRVAFKDAPNSMPFFECVKIFYGDLCTMKFWRIYDLWSKVIEVFKLVTEAGGVISCYYYFRGIRTAYIISDPEDSLTALKACAEKAIIYEIWEPWLGVSTFIGDMQINKRHRKLFSKSLMPSNMDAFFKFFNIHSERLVQKLSKHVDKGPFDMVWDLRFYNLKLFCDTFLAINDFENVNLKEYLDAVSIYVKIAAKKLENPFLQYDFFFKRSEFKKKHDAALEILHHTSNEVISLRRKKWKDIRENKCKPSDHVVLLDILLEATENGIMAEETLRSEVDGLIFAGHDTSAFSFLYTLVLMGSYPEVQKRAYEEVQRELGDKKIVTKDNLSKMVYLEAIIKESVRIYPYVAVLPRIVKEDVKLKNCVMRAGSTLFVCAWQVHRHESWGPDAEEFRPDRWLEPEKLPKPTVLLSFSDGPRNCIGKKYAINSMKTLLAYLVRSYKFTADHKKLRFDYLGVLEPLSGHHVAIEHRPMENLISGIR